MTLEKRDAPRVARWIARVATRRSPYAESLLGDLDERFVATREGSRIRAQLEYWKHTLSVSLHFLPSALRRTPAVAAGDTANNDSRHHDQGDHFVQNILGDLRFALRSLRRAPAFALAAIIALGLGTGATAAVFSMLRGVVLEPLPYASPDRLVMLWDTDHTKGLTHQPISPVTFHDYRSLATVFGDVAGWWRPQVNLVDDSGEPVRASAIEVTDNLFTVLGVQPFMGSNFSHHERLYGTERQVIISHRLWQSRYGGRPDVIGKVIDVNGSYTIIGVMPERFAYPADTDLWMQLQWDFANHSRGARFVEAVGRLRNGVTAEQANRELATLSERLGSEFATTNKNWVASVVSLDREVSGVFRPALVALFGASMLLLLIACINVANLLLARSAARRREVAVRAALGAARSRLLRLFFTESAILAILGATLGLAIATLSVKSLLAWSPIEIPRADSIRVDHLVMAFATLVACVTAVGFGLAPALVMSRTDLQESLRDGTRGVSSHARRIRATLVIAEVALSVLLLSGSGLLIRSVSNLLQASAGVDATSTIAADVQLPYGGYSYARVSQFFAALRTTLDQNPAVERVGMANFLPLAPGWRLPYQVARAPQPEAPLAQFHIADEDYFEALHVPLVAGRHFTAHDDSASIPVVIVNEAFARHIAGDGPAVGTRIVTNTRNIGPLSRRLSSGNEVEIVGVVGDIKNNSVRNVAEPAMYFPFRQFPSRGMFIVVRGHGDAGSVAQLIRTEVQKLDPSMAIGEVTPMSRVLAAEADPPKFLMLLMGVFAAFALLLAAVGVYGVIAFMVSHRRREMGIRLALGAQPSMVLRLVLKDGMGMALTGTAIGIVVTLIASRVLGSFLYGIAPNDPLTLIAVVALVVTVALIACIVPARRAAAEDPSNALRAE